MQSNNWTRRQPQSLTTITMLIRIKSNVMENELDITTSMLTITTLCKESTEKLTGFAEPIEYTSRFMLMQWPNYDLRYLSFVFPVQY